MTIEVNTKLGKISGNQQEGYQEFLGLRYAEPPIGELRYEPPQLITAYSAPYDATEIGNTPPQAYLEDPPLTIPFP